jgi:uncharacterized protein
MNDREVRALPVAELRVARAGDRRKIVGYAAVFDSWTDLGEFREVIRSGAFARAIREGQDVRALVNHDPNHLVGRTGNGTLHMVEDGRGLRVEIDPPDTQVGRDAVRMIEDGYMDAMSFAFRVPSRSAQRWNQDQTERELLDLDVFDVSVVTYPAYKDTSASIRSAATAMRTRDRERRLAAMDARLAAFEVRHGK